MNLENFKQARQWVADQEHFDLTEWHDYTEENTNREMTRCGSISCIGGTINLNLILSGEIDKSLIDEVGPAVEFLELNHKQSEKLFYGANDYYRNPQTGFNDIEKSHVLTKMDAIIEAGEFV